MNSLLDFQKITKDQLVLAIEHLAYSFKKVEKLPTGAVSLDNETLETWESFCARFCRVADIFLMKYLKIMIRLDDPGFNGGFRDFLNQAEKLNIIKDLDLWLKIRELRNIVAHEYSTQDIEILFIQIRNFTPTLLNLRDII